MVNVEQLAAKFQSMNSGAKFASLTGEVVRDKLGKVQTTETVSATPTAADKRAKAVDEHDKKIEALIKKSAAQVEHHPAGDDNTEMWTVTSPLKGNERVAEVFQEDDGTWVASNEGGTSVGRRKTSKEAISDAKIYVEAGGSDEINQSDFEARQEVLNHIDVPEGMKVVDIQDTKWGSVYYKVRDVHSVDEDGEPDDYTDYKLSIRNHEPSPFREKEFGRSDYWVEVPKDASPQQLSDAVAKIEKWLKKKSVKPIPEVPAATPPPTPEPIPPKPQPPKPELSTLKAIENGTENDAYTKKGQYVSIAPNLKVNLNDDTFEISGLAHVKTVLEEGFYKSVNSKDKTIAKNFLRGLTPVSKFRTFALDASAFEHARIDGETWILA